MRSSVHREAEAEAEAEAETEIKLQKNLYLTIMNFG
jgi:hypothetical protein